MIRQIWGVEKEEETSGGDIRIVCVKYDLIRVRLIKNIEKNKKK